ncbi:MAG: ArsR family transcriptional regulator [Nitrosopumilus sp.]
MQVLQSKYKIEEDATKDDLLSIVSDKYCRSILEAIMDKPKSAMEITAETKTPISTVYRRIQMLHDRKLLQTSGMISGDGKKLFLYKSKIRGIQSTFKDGKVEVELILNNQ